MSDAGPEDSMTTDLTPRQREILDFGWEIMKSYGESSPLPGIPPQIFLWLEEDGWEGGHTITAEHHNGTHVAVRVVPWETLRLLVPTTMN